MLDIDKDIEGDFQKLLEKTRNKNLSRTKVIFFISGTITGFTIAEIICLFF